MTVHPIDDRVLVEPVEEETRVGTIVIPDTAKEKPVFGKVIAVGTDKELKELIAVGDRVLFGKYAGDEIKIEGRRHLLIKREDLLAKVKK
ncbi:MAG TPA: co-chaperone GroES [Candidatus Aminicenantes bacterium]|nr:co-chaperone GroES [Candidatus Aminicenantes bacterium]